MALQCDLSGEILATSSDDVVVTPSGHICLKRLLLSRLAENRGMDPFHEDRPLSEDELVTLKLSKPMVVPPRTNQTTSMCGLLKALQNEYDALVLELFDTRKALEETRRELSQALYQNDAAMRVVARIAMERDQARQLLEEWKAGGGVPSNNTQAGTGDSEMAGTSLSGKKRKLDGDNDKTQSSASSHLVNDIPKEDLDSMINVWERLHKSRKALQKDAAAVAPTPNDVAAFKVTRTENWLPENCEGITAISMHGETTIVTTGKDKSLLVYDMPSKQVAVTTSSEAEATCLDMNETHIVAGCSNGKVQIWKSDGEALGQVEISSLESSVVAVHIHPDKSHVLAASQLGVLSLIRISENGDNKLVAIFKKEDAEDVSFTCGALHPDGLIYVTGCSSGKIFLWDLKSRSMAGTLEEAANDNDPVFSLHVSNNGYHIAAVYGTGKVCVWDLRKQKVIAALNQDDKALESVMFAEFDPSGKYLAYGGKGGIRIITVKEWDSITAALDEELSSGIVWGKNWLAVSSTQHRQINFYGKEA
ncbi:hypothetical protein ACA910_006283 [Epithemia clementina (nom. ined.)]